MHLNVRKSGLRHATDFMASRWAAYTASIGLPFPQRIPSRDRFTDTWKELLKPLVLDAPMSVPQPPTSGRFWPLQSSVRYIQSRPPLVDATDWKRPLNFLLRGDAYPCTGASVTQLCIGLFKHHTRPAHPPTYG